MWNENMWEGKRKAVTFSFDDGVKQDLKYIEILNRYGLKATFNLNSALLGTLNTLDCNGKLVRHDKVRACDVKETYAGHEVAVHTLTHPNLTELDDDTVVRQVEEDRKALETLCGYKVRGMAYPCGGVNNDDRVANLIKENTPLKYARTITSSGSFDLQDNLLRFNPTVYVLETEEMFALAERFLKEESERPRLFYIWGHSYEADCGYISYGQMEKFCRMISGCDDVFYGTNAQVLLG